MPSSSTATLTCNSRPPGDSQQAPQIEVPLADISSEFRNLQLDDRENRLLVRRAPGDSLLVRMSHPVDGLLSRRDDALRSHSAPACPWPPTPAWRSRPSCSTPRSGSCGPAQEVRPAAGKPIPLELTLPEEEGVYDIADHGPTERRLAAGPAPVVALEAGDRRAARATCRHFAAAARGQVWPRAEPGPGNRPRQFPLVGKGQAAVPRCRARSFPRTERPAGQRHARDHPSPAGRCLAAQAQRRRRPT